MDSVGCPGCNTLPNMTMVHPGVCSNLQPAAQATRRSPGAYTLVCKYIADVLVDRLYAQRSKSQTQCQTISVQSQVHGPLNLHLAERLHSPPSLCLQ
jgi:hypothetical protein